jgi:hypothetical protein
VYAQHAVDPHLMDLLHYPAVPVPTEKME